MFSTLNSLLVLNLNPVLRLVIALVPVVAFLVTLFLLDARHLVSIRRVFWALVAGGICAGGSYLINNPLLGWTRLPLLSFAVLVAPVVEELLKAIYCLWLVRTRRVGFLVDAAILGFAVGAGFALVENIYYLRQIDRPELLVWVVRGLGTAVMHGGASSIFTVLLQSLGRQKNGRFHVGGALAVAILIHAGFNGMMIHPVMATLGIFVVMPLVMVVIYRFGERNLKIWLGRGMDQDLALLELIHGGGVEGSPVGDYLQELKSRFRATDVVDMLCLLRLQTELNLVVRGGMLLRENGLVGTLPPDLSSRLAEVAHLQNSLGTAGLLALGPLSRWDGRNPWQRRLLRQWQSQTNL